MLCVKTSMVVQWLQPVAQNTDSIQRYNHVSRHHLKQARHVIFFRSLPEFNRTCNMCIVMRLIKNVRETSPMIKNK